MIETLAQQARQASIKMGALTTAQKNQALKTIAQALKTHESRILEVNQHDLDRAEKDQVKPVLIKRLKFDSSKLAGVIEGIDSTIKLDDPTGRTLACTELDKGLELYRVSSPIGVLGIVFESRPDALVQISTLALKSGNAVLLKGGSEAAESNRILADVIYQASLEAGLPEGWMALLETREDVKSMLALDEYIDLVIPRGSNEFVKYIMDNTRIAVLGHADGICHIYIDKAADLEMAVNVSFDSKCQYAAVCNAVETLLVHRDIATDFLGAIRDKYEMANVELRGCEKTQGLIDCKPATDEDWRTEYNDLVLSIKIVESVEEAIDHINTYSSHHTDAIITSDKTAAKRFLELVDSADVFWNCSTRFADGFRYGLGAEVGISTHKIHARGPVGLEGLVTYKWKLIGSGQYVAQYGPNGKSFTHKKLDKELEIYPMG